MTTAIVKGSIADIAQQQGKSIAEAFLTVECIVIVDVSGSMHYRDSRGGRRRYDVACDELARVQAALPGKVGVIAFDDWAVFVSGGRPDLLGGGTNLAGALAFARQSDVAGIRFVVISDGQPNDASAALNEARKFAGRIDTVFVGPENDVHARKFLDELAKVRGGTHTTTRIESLATTTLKLLA